MQIKCKSRILGMKIVRMFNFHHVRGPRSVQTAGWASFTIWDPNGYHWLPKPHFWNFWYFYALILINTFTANRHYSADRSHLWPFLIQFWGSRSHPIGTSPAGSGRVKEHPVSVSWCPSDSSGHQETYQLVGGVWGYPPPPTDPPPTLKLRLGVTIGSLMHKWLS